MRKSWMLTVLFMLFLILFNEDLIQSVQCQSINNTCSSHGFKLSSSTCLCDDGWLGDECSLAALASSLLSTSPYFYFEYAMLNHTSDNQSNSNHISIDRVYVSYKIDAKIGWSGFLIDPKIRDGMSNGDAWIFYADSSNHVTAYDLYSRSVDAPDGMESQDLRLISSQVTSNGKLKIHFNRDVTTGDKADKDITHDTTFVTWAVGSLEGSTMKEHSKSESGRINVNFYTSELVILSKISEGLYFFPFLIALLLFCLVAYFSRRLSSIRQTKLMRSIMHQPLESNLICRKQEAPTHGIRTNLVDTLTLDLRSTVRSSTLGELIAFLFYVGALIGSIYLAKNEFKNGGLDFTFFWGDLAGLHLALALLPVSRTSIFLVTCGISYERALKWHRFVARGACLSLIGHWITIPGDSDSGTRAGICLVSMSALGFEPIRRYAYRFFKYTHLLFIIPTYLLACLHSRNVLILCAIPLFLYLIDRGLRFYRSTRTSKIVGMEFIEFDDSVIIHLKVKQNSFRFNVGQYSFLNIPSLSRVAWHPISMSSSPQTPDIFSFHILAYTHGLEVGIRSVTSKFDPSEGLVRRTSSNSFGIGMIEESMNQGPHETQSQDTTLENSSSLQPKSNITSLEAFDRANLQGSCWAQNLVITSLKYLATCNVASVKKNHDLESNQVTFSFPIDPFQIRVDGPYGHINMAIKQDYHTLILCCGGVGATPAISILYELFSYMTSDAPHCPIKMVYFIWTVHDSRIFEAIHSQLWQKLAQHPKFQLHFYATRKSSSLKDSQSIKIQSGRPQLKVLFESIVATSLIEKSQEETREVVQVEMASKRVGTENPSSRSDLNERQAIDQTLQPTTETNLKQRCQSGTGIGVFACGPVSLVADAEEQSAYHHIDFHKEVFYF